MPQNLTWEITPLPLDLKFTWRISRNQSDTKTNFVVKVTDGQFTGRGEVAPNVRYNETPEQIVSQFDGLKSLLNQITNTTEQLNSGEFLAEVCNSLRFGITSAFIHFRSASSGISVAKMLGLTEVKKVATCFSIPLMEPGHLQDFIKLNNLQRFPLLKVKVAKEQAASIIKEVAKLTQKPLLVDGNEAWINPEQVLQEAEKMNGADVKFIEQPMPAHLTEEYKFLKKHSPYSLFADESVTDTADFKELVNQFDGINVKLMKAGSYQNSLWLLQEAKRHGLKTMIGCMIESSLGISSAMHLSPLADFCDLDGFLMLKNDPFQLISEENGVLVINQ